MKQKIADTHSAPYGEAANQLSVEGMIALKEELQARVAMQDEAIKRVLISYGSLPEIDGEYVERMALDFVGTGSIKSGESDSKNFYRTVIDPCEQALSATSEDVAAWQEKQLAPLRREVAMLVNLVSSSLHSKTPEQHHEYCNAARAALNDTRATAEAYEKEVAAKALLKYESLRDTYTHTCVACHISYKPESANEDCPHCGCTDAQAKEILAAELRGEKK